MSFRRSCFALPCLVDLFYMYIMKKLRNILENCEKPAATAIEPGASDLS